MRIKTIKLENFLTHASSTISLPEKGIVLITGSNGAGKSSILETVPHTLWGKGLRGMTCWGEEKTRVGVKFYDGTEVVRTKTGKSSVLRLRKDGDVEESLTRVGQSKINQVFTEFGLWRRTYAFSSCDTATFSSSTDSGRKEILEALTRLDQFEPAQKRAKRARAALDEEKLTHDRLLEKAKWTLEQADLQMKASVAEEAEHNLAKVPPLELPACPPEPPVPEAPVEQVGSLAPEERKPGARPLPKATVTGEDMSVEVLRLQELIGQEVARHERLKERKGQHSTDVSLLNARYAEVSLRAKRYESGFCPTCNQPIASDVLDTLDEEKRTCKEQETALAAELEIIEHRIAKVTQAQTIVEAELNKVRKAQQALSAELSADERALAVWESQVKQVKLENERAFKRWQEGVRVVAEGNKARRATWQGAVRSHKQRYEVIVKEWKAQCTVSRAAHKKREEQWVAKAARISERGSERDLALLAARTAVLTETTKVGAISQKFRVLSEIIKALGPKGIKSLMLVDILSSLQVLMNKWLDVLATPGTMVATLRGADDGSISLIIKRRGLELLYQGLSSGERRRVDVAVMFAMSEISRMLNNLDISTLFLDEVMDSLDDDGKLLAIDALHKVAETTPIVIVSHDTTLMTELRPDMHYTVEEGRVS